MKAENRINKQPYPERCLRGLSKPEYIEREQDSSIPDVTWKAFEPHYKTRDDRKSKRGKSDHFEASVNWDDHVTDSFQILCNDVRNAGQGIVSILLADLKEAKQANPLAAESLDWERDDIKGNPFHGNLLFSGNLPKYQVRELAAVVASHVRPNMILIEPKDYETELAARKAQTIAVNKREHKSFLRCIFTRLYTLLDQYWRRIKD